MFDPASLSAIFQFWSTFCLKWTKIWLDMIVKDHLESFYSTIQPEPLPLDMYMIYVSLNRDLGMQNMFCAEINYHWQMESANRGEGQQSLPTYAWICNKVLQMFYVLYFIFICRAYVRQMLVINLPKWNHLISYLKHWFYLKYLKGNKSTKYPCL